VEGRTRFSQPEDLEGVAQVSYGVIVAEIEMREDPVFEIEHALELSFSSRDVFIETEFAAKRLEPRSAVCLVLELDGRALELLGRKPNGRQRREKKA
jgi:hypothetical protein